jgi:hypothetical protein
MAFLLPRISGAQLDVVYSAAPSDCRAAFLRIAEFAVGASFSYE